MAPPTVIIALIQQTCALLRAQPYMDDEHQKQLEEEITNLQLLAKGLKTGPETGLQTDSGADKFRAMKALADLL